MNGVKKFEVENGKFDTYVVSKDNLPSAWHFAVTRAVQTFPWNDDSISIMRTTFMRVMMCMGIEASEYGSSVIGRKLDAKESGVCGINDVIRRFDDKELERRSQFVCALYYAAHVLNSGNLGKECQTIGLALMMYCENELKVWETEDLKPIANLDPLSKRWTNFHNGKSIYLEAEAVSFDYCTRDGMKSEDRDLKDAQIAAKFRNLIEGMTNAEFFHFDEDIGSPWDFGGYVTNAVLDGILMKERVGRMGANEMQRLYDEGILSDVHIIDGEFEKAVYCFYEKGKTYFGDTKTIDTHIVMERNTGRILGRSYDSKAKAVNDAKHKVKSHPLEAYNSELRVMKEIAERGLREYPDDGDLEDGE